MLNLFRNLRKNMLTKGKTTKYLKYALGEIALVMIGILLALQINNWNEERKSKSFEREMLSQIRTNLIQDKSNLESFRKNGHAAVASVDKILAREISETDRDSLKYWLGDIIQFDRFQPLTNAYELIKSKGLDQISNKELRFLLGTYYDDKANHIIKAVMDIEDAFSFQWLPIMKEHVVDFKFKNYLETDDINLFNPPNTARKILILNRDNYAGSVLYIDQGILLIDDILAHIDQELPGLLQSVPKQ